MGVALTNLVAMSVPFNVKSEENVAPVENKGLKVRFLGTGAADWNGKNEQGEQRRFSSVLLDNRVLIDFTSTAFDMLPADCKPKILFYTHSHRDHYEPEAALRLGVKYVYVSDTWYDIAKMEFSRAAKELKMELPMFVPVFIGQPVCVDDLVLTPFAANHSTDNMFEQTLIYLVEKKDVRLLYATDTSGIPSNSARQIGIDVHKDGKPITALIMEATMGLDHYMDYRIFGHSSVQDVERTVRVLTATKRYIAVDGQPVYLTHLARTLHGSQSELDATLPKPLVAAYDGLEVTFA